MLPLDQLVAVASAPVLRLIERAGMTDEFVTAGCVTYLPSERLLRWVRGLPGQMEDAVDVTGSGREAIYQKTVMNWAGFGIDI
jgi:hypothetical protein